MPLAASIMVLLVAVLHLYFMVLEMFLWNRPYGRKTFRMSAERAEATASLAANQGLYNGFLAAGLAWSLLSPDPAQALSLKFFFLGCVLVAGLYGGLTSMRPILYVQALPAAIALILVWLGRVA